MKKDEELTGASALALEFTPMRALLWMLGAFCVMVSLAVFLIAAMPSSRSDLVTLGLVSSIAFLLVAAMLLGRFPAGSRLSQAIGARATHPAATLVALLIGLCLQVPADLLQRFTLTFFPLSGAEATAYSTTFQVDSILQGVAVVLVTAALVPLAEEVFFRGAVYGALRRGGSSPALAALVTGLGFLFCHGGGRQLLPLVLVASVFSLLRAVSGSLLPALLAHVAFNAVAVLLGVMGEGQERHLSTLVEVAISLFLVFLLTVFIRYVWAHPYSKESRSLEASVALIGDVQEKGHA